MNIEELFAICQQNGRRPLMISCGNSAAVAVMGMEGRIYYAHDGQLVSLFRRAAAENISNKCNGYFNPGGDGLWPAPEGTTLGYQYTTGDWRVSTALTSAQYETVSQTSDSFEIAAEIDLINDQQLGIPCIFRRRSQIALEPDGTTTVEQFDSIEYIGTRELKRGEFLLAPWSLAQFAVDDSAVARFGSVPMPIRDLYQPSSHLLTGQGDTIEMRHDTVDRIQLALPEAAGFVELVLPRSALKITRTSAPLPDGHSPADIADAPGNVPPGAGVRYSIYNDPSGFMELEAAGGCPDKLTPGTVLELRITNKFTTLPA